MLTAEELKKKREAELMWRKILAYYMMETYVTKAQAQAEAEMRAAYLTVGGYIRKYGLVNRLFEKRGNDPSPAEMLAKIAADEEPDSPLGALLAEVQRQPRSTEKLEGALARVIVEEPPRVLLDAQKERDRRTEWERTHEKTVDGFELVDEERVRYEQRLEQKMAFLRIVMPPELYKELEHNLSSGEYTISPEQLNERERQAGRKRDYKSYMAEKRVEPQEKAGKLANAGDVYGAAAYMLAAWEQKDAPEFDEAKADARAMELSGSRAFKAYMKGHPGNLLAAARGTAVEETHTGIAALSADLSRRDAILVSTRDNLKKMAQGKTKCFYNMLNTLDRYVNADTEPSQQERKDLVKSLAEYINTDCAPNSREYNKACFTEAMRSVKALLPEDGFAKVVEQVNVGREPKVRAADFDAAGPVAEAAAPERALEKQPILQRSLLGTEADG